MPKVALTQEQRRKYEIQKFYTDALDTLNAERGRKRKSGNAFADEMGISRSSWCRWNNGALENAELGSFLKVLYQAGFRLAIEKK